MKIEVIDSIGDNGFKIIRATFDDPKLDDFSNLSLNYGKKITTFNYQMMVSLETFNDHPKEFEYIKSSFIQKAKEKYIRHCVYGLLSQIQRYPLGVLQKYLDVPEDYLN